MQTCPITCQLLRGAWPQSLGVLSRLHRGCAPTELAWCRAPCLVDTILMHERAPGHRIDKTAVRLENSVRDRAPVIGLRCQRQGFGWSWFEVEERAPFRSTSGEERPLVS